MNLSIQSSINNRSFLTNQRPISLELLSCAFVSRIQVIVSIYHFEGTDLSLNGIPLLFVASRISSFNRISDILGKIPVNIGFRAHAFHKFMKKVILLSYLSYMTDLYFSILMGLSKLLSVP